MLQIDRGGGCQNPDKKEARTDLCQAQQNLALVKLSLVRLQVVLKLFQVDG